MGAESEWFGELDTQETPIVRTATAETMVERRNGEFRRYLDLPEALDAATPPPGAEWRIHFHVPVFLDGIFISIPTTSPCP